MGLAETLLVVASTRNEEFRLFLTSGFRLLCGEDLHCTMARQLETRPRSCYDHFNASRTVSGSTGLEVLREPTEELWEAPPSENQWQEPTMASSDEKDEQSTEMFLKYIGNLLELFETLFETLLTQVETEKEYSGRNEESLKDVESRASSEEELCGLIGNSPESSDDSFPTSETEQPGCTTSFAEQESRQEVDWSLIDKDMASLADSFDVEQDNFNEDIRYSCGDEHSKSWVSKWETPQDDFWQDVDWSFDDDHLKSGTSSSETSRENSNQESKRNLEGVATIHPTGDSGSNNSQCGQLFDEYISNLCECFEYSTERENAWKTSAGDHWLSGGTLEASITDNHSSEAEKAVYRIRYANGGVELFPDVDTASKSFCCSSLLPPSPASPSTPNSAEEMRSPFSAQIEACAPPEIFETLSSATDEFYNSVEATATYGPVGTPTTINSRVKTTRHD